jgi:glycosyltransferase involved in cell wall biosynthesis
MKSKVVIPTLSEGATIAHAIDRVPVSVLPDGGYETAIYVNDADSEDVTQQKGLEKDAMLPVKRTEMGSAMRLAFASVRAGYFIMTDGDDTYTSEHIIDFARLFSTYGLILGSRIKPRIEEGDKT